LTTIAVRKGALATDSRVTSEDGLSPETTKKAWISQKHKAIFACAGDLANVNAAAKMVEAKRKLPWDAPTAWAHRDMPDLDDSIIIVLRKDGRMFVIEAQGWYESESPFYAVGSGAMAALAAMKMGASAQRAVKIAIELDHMSGPPVVVFKTSDIR
jgi:ATP-dependent protease HslVU (ClpYQ) peptidase subunit